MPSAPDTFVTSTHDSGRIGNTSKCRIPTAKRNGDANIRSRRCNRMTTTDRRTTNPRDSRQIHVSGAGDVDSARQNEKL